MPGVFTVYCCGTNFNRQRLDELTANLANRTYGQENLDWRVNDGPGSSSFPASSAKGRAPKDTQRPASDREHALADAATSRGTVAQGLGVAVGYGWYPNLDHTVDVLRARLDSPGEPLAVVNMAGWSRGAITCHMIANALASDADERLRRLRVNIFALDPVTGPGYGDDPSKVLLPKTVNEYAVVQMEDDWRQMMMPSFPRARGAGSRTLAYPMPGDHATGAMIHCGPVGEIVQHLAHGFLTRHGTQLRSRIRLTPERLCELYALVRLSLPELSSRHGPVVQQIAGGVNLRYQGIANPQRGGVFVNPHHAEVFAAAHPVLSNVLHARSVREYKTQLAHLANRFPATHKWATQVCRLG